MFRRLCFELLDRADHLLTLAGLTVLDWLAGVDASRQLRCGRDRNGPPPETPTDRAIREQGERLRKAFPFLDERRRRGP